MGFKKMEKSTFIGVIGGILAVGVGMALKGADCLAAQCFELLLVPVNPEDFVGLGQGGHFLHPFYDVLVVGHDKPSFGRIFPYSGERTGTSPP